MISLLQGRELSLNLKIAKPNSFYHFNPTQIKSKLIQTIF